MKIGITGFTEQNIASLFVQYDTEKVGKINYKDFIGILFNNPSIMENPEKLNELNTKKQEYPYAPTPSQSQYEQEPKNQNYNPTSKQVNKYRNQSQNRNVENRNRNKSIDEIIDIIKNKIKMRGIRCLISLENNFRSLDDDNSQTINFDSFESSAQDFRFGITSEEVEKLFDYFDKE